MAESIINVIKIGVGEYARSLTDRDLPVSFSKGRRFGLENLTPYCNSYGGKTKLRSEIRD